jgi:hypothetical protein
MVSAIVTDINEKGLVAGTCNDDLRPDLRAFPNPKPWGCYWDVIKGTHDYVLLATPPDRRGFARALRNDCRAINRNGVVVGGLQRSAEGWFFASETAYAFSLVSSPDPDLGRLPQGDKIVSIAQDISDGTAANIVGSVTVPGQPTQGFVYKQYFGSISLQPPLSGDSSMEAWAITGAGDDFVCLSRSETGVKRLVHVPAAGSWRTIGPVESIGRINVRITEQSVRRPEVKAYGVTIQSVHRSG